jgi:prolyl 4-hydroxylase
LDCSKELLTTKNVEGSALFWVNLDEDGQGRMDTLHAGLPALNGDKVGLNIWTDIDTKEVMRRGMFKTQSKHFYNPTQEFLEKHGMTRNED